MGNTYKENRLNINSICNYSTSYRKCSTLFILYTPTFPPLPPPPSTQYIFYFHFQHVVFGVCRLIDIMVPDVPESLELKIKRERYLAKQALADAEALVMVRIEGIVLVVISYTYCNTKHVYCCKRK